MIDDLAKDYVHDELRFTRQALVWKLDGLSEYDIRRPLTTTGTNLLGLVKHLASWEARYFGEIFDRPFPEPLPRWQDSDGSDPRTLTRDPGQPHTSSAVSTISRSFATSSS